MMIEEMIIDGGRAFHYSTLRDLSQLAIRALALAQLSQTQQHRALFQNSHSNPPQLTQPPTQTTLAHVRDSHIMAAIRLEHHRIERSSNAHLHHTNTRQVACKR